jgi:mRNA interferase YafQ
MRELIFTKRFQKDVLLCQKQGKDLSKLQRVFDILIEGGAIPEQYKDHPLQGKWKGYRDLHVAPDWILIYQEQGTQIVLLSATGSHARLLKK